MNDSSSLSAQAGNGVSYPQPSQSPPPEQSDACGQETLRFRQLADAMPQIVWVAQADGNPEYFNLRWHLFTGATAEQSRGDGWLHPFHPDDRPEIIRRWRHSLATGAIYENKCRIRRASDGAFRWHLCRALPQVDESGRVRQWYGTCTDFHETRQTERRLVEQLNFTRGITDSLAQGLYAVDCDGRVTFVNPAAERLLGWESSELLGKDIHAAIHFQHADHSAYDRESCPLLEVIRSGKIVRADDDVFTTRWGTLIPISYSSAPVLEEGKVVGAVVTFQDITERKRQEQALLDSQLELKRHSEELEQRVQERTAELRGLNTRLEASNRELQDFASVASHDLQEPLRKIQAFGDRLANRSSSALGPDGQDFLRRMKNAAERMQKLITDLLGFSRVTTKAQPFVCVDLKQIAAEVLIDLESAIERCGASVELGDLPEIDADPMQMRQLLQNLIGNALKFHKPGVPPHVRIYGQALSPATGESEGDSTIASCQILVQDNGIGFDEKYLDRIFNVFQRLHGRNTYEGTGIGLAVCRKIAERHGGSITAQSKPGEGSTFIVTLPIRHPDTASHQDTIDQYLEELNAE